MNTITSMEVISMKNKPKKTKKQEPKTSNDQLGENEYPETKECCGKSTCK